ncbi:MAG: D-alanyl-D-alanine carboxypeptidase/D-alanyl-D-alanine-endopeptidase [Actinobacteria bacterium HGW-Actinobacteria-4]|nr:MAG: D-alanyl-D-alanine carboxypeptidase/D-alanyl-D-alanine-endopeptidase [Actinobacteria bacterium HGW-Actinobacteria-4]
MRHKAATAAVTVGMVLVGAGAYAIADAYDVVPGWITAEPVPQPPAPFLAHLSVASADVPRTPVASLASAEAPLPNAAVVQALVQKLRDDPRTGRSVNVAIVDVLTGELIAGIDAAETQVPASTTKTITAVAALGALGPDFTTRTTVLWDPATARLTLVAGGDMMLAAGAGHHGERRDANGWAGLGDLAEAVVAASALEGVTTVTVVVDDSAFPGPRINPEWPDYAPRMGYAAGVTGLAVNVAKMTDELYAQRHADPSLAAGNDFAVALRSHGLTVTQVTRGSSRGGTEIAGVESAPLSLVAENLLWYSDNTIAENVARVLAIETGHAATPTGAAQATIAQLAQMGIDVEGLRLYDGAGFSSRNRISPLHLTDTMLAALEDPGARGLFDFLPVAGVEGTVGERYWNTDAAGMVRAKTGSLTGVTALAGTVMTADGRLLAFAFLADGMPAGQERPRAAFDDLLFALVACGCQ